jgi:multimeric flavodoxin WrbA
MWEAIRISDTPQESLRDRLMDEFLAADIYVISVPIYNFIISSTLKAYIDQIMRIILAWLDARCSWLFELIYIRWAW